jgi:hypothetical protein
MRDAGVTERRASEPRGEVSVLRCPRCGLTFAPRASWLGNTSTCPRWSGPSRTIVELSNAGKAQRALTSGSTPPTRRPTRPHPHMRAKTGQRSAGTCRSHIGCRCLRAHLGNCLSSTRSKTADTQPKNRSPTQGRDLHVPLSSRSFRHRSTLVFLRVPRSPRSRERRWDRPTTSPTVRWLAVPRAVRLKDRRRSDSAQPRRS